MAPPERLQNKRPLWLFAIVLLASACSPSSDTPALRSLDIGTAGLEVRNGLYYYNKQPFSGCLFALQKQGKDTPFSGFFSQGKENGIHKKWYANGRLAEQRTFTAGLKTGLHQGFWDNGKPRFRFHFKQDLYEGTQYKWYEDGVLYTRKNYQNGQEQGMQQEWSRQGKLIINYQALNGRQYGNIGKKNCASMWADSIYTKPHR